MGDSKPRAFRINWNDKANCFQGNDSQKESLPENIIGVRNRIYAESGLKKRGVWLSALFSITLLIGYSVAAYFLYQTKHDKIGIAFLAVGPFIAFGLYVCLTQSHNRLDQVLRYLNSNKLTFEQTLVVDGYTMDAFFVKGSVF